MSYFFVVLIGCAVGVSELVSRYKDKPSAIPRSASAWVYVALNGAGSAGALGLSNTFGWKFGANTASQASTLQIIVCGLAAMAVLRASFASVAIDGRPVPVGPALLLASFLGAADRGVDRVRSRQRILEARDIMKDVSFERAREALPTSALASMQNVTAAEAQEFRSAVDALRSSQMSDDHKSFNLGLITMKLIGPAGLKETVAGLGEGIRRAT